MEPTTSAENDTPEKDPLDVKNVKTTQKKNLLKKMQSQFLNDEDEDDDDETDDEQVLKPYECGKCKSKFSTIGKKTYPYHKYCNFQFHGGKKGILVFILYHNYFS